MALVSCPECKNEISEYAENCPTCGFPLKKFIEENNFSDISGVLICPKCAKVYNGWNLKYELPQKLVCEYCNTILVQTNESTEEIYKLSAKLPDDDFNKKCIGLAKKYGNDQFDNEENQNMLEKRSEHIQNSIEKYELRKQQSQQSSNLPHCPKCGSTAITAGQRGYSLLTGFLGSNKTVNRCANCGYTWKPKL